MGTFGITELPQRLYFKKYGIFGNETKYPMQARAMVTYPLLSQSAEGDLNCSVTSIR